MRLGCLNHALLTAQAIRSAGLTLAGWVANSTGPAMEAFDENLQTLERRLPALRLGTVPYLGPSVHARAGQHLAGWNEPVWCPLTSS